MVNKIKKYIRSKKISQSEFARRIGTSRFTLSRWMRGHNKPSKAYEQLIWSVMNENK
jgi:DNA-binding transcriptional regulator YiaG